MEKEPEDSLSSKNQGLAVITRAPAPLNPWVQGTPANERRAGYPLPGGVAGNFGRDASPASPVPRRKFPMGVAALKKGNEGRWGGERKEEMGRERWKGNDWKKEGK